MASLSEAERLRRRVRRVERVARLRQLLALALVAAALALAALYWVGRHRAQASAGGGVPFLGLQIQQSANGVTIAKDEDGKPVFRVHAARADKLRVGGNDVLHDVQIQVYDKTGTQADQISGDQFGYNEASGALSAEGRTHIDLFGPSPIHVEASDLSYNVKGGTGTISQGLTFSYQAAQGSAASATLDSHAARLDLAGGVHLLWQRAGAAPVRVESATGEVRRLGQVAGKVASADGDDAVIALEGNASLASATQSLAAQRLVFYLRRDGSLHRLQATGGLRARDTDAAHPVEVSAQDAEAEFVALGPHRVAVDHLNLSGGVQFEQTQAQRRSVLAADHMQFEFAPDHRLAKLEARLNASLQMTGDAPESLTAPGLNFIFAPCLAGGGTCSGGVRLTAVDSVGRAELSAARLPASTASSGASGAAEAQSDRLHIELDASQEPTLALASGNVQLRQTIPAAVRGTPAAVRGTPAAAGGIPGGARTSSSDELQVRFAAGQVAAATETGHVTMAQGEERITAARAVYTVGSRTLALSGGVEGGDPQTRILAPQATWGSGADGSGALAAWGGVSVSRVGGGAMALTGLPSIGGRAAAPSAASPVVITAERLDWKLGPPRADGPRLSRGEFLGSVRLMQAPYLLRADTLQLSATEQSLDAQGHIVTSLVESGKPVTISASNLDYRQSDHEAVYEGGVRMDSIQGRMAAPKLEVKLSAAGALSSAVGSGGVRLTQPGRTATASRLSYSVASNQVTLTGLGGATPSILDAEHGKITGDPLTFSLTSDEIQIGSKPGARAQGEMKAPPLAPHKGHN